MQVRHKTERRYHACSSMHLGSDLGAICGIIASVALWIVVTPFVWNRNMEKAVTKLAMLFILVGIIIGIISEVRKKGKKEPNTL